MQVRSADSEIERDFSWAEEMAMRYVRLVDPVGPWYEAALPGRRAFCMRDVAHQSTGAHVLGLAHVTKNMLLRFAENISLSRRWCSFWEITADNQPAAVDYRSDQDFWYNLPANFDILDCCQRQYEWAGDTEYLTHPALQNFYARTTEDYRKAWDRDGDGILEHSPGDGRRGIATYNEQVDEPLMGGDMVAAEYAGFRAAEQLALVTNQRDSASRYAALARSLRHIYNREWWDEESERFYSFIDSHGAWVTNYGYIANILPLYFNIVDSGRKTQAALRPVIQHRDHNVEDLTYLVDVLYRYDRPDLGYEVWRSFPRRERCDYPEVSFCMSGAIVTGMAGVRPKFSRTTIDTKSRLMAHQQWIEVSGIPVFDGTLDVTHIGTSETRITNRTGRTIIWKAIFASGNRLAVGNRLVLGHHRENEVSGQVEVFTDVIVQSGQESTVRVVD